MISVIIPVYNTEKYLSQCLDSILNQTYTDLEILIIDDGSTDSSPHICDEYSNKDDRVKVWHRENSGVSASRNFGLSNCHGDWVSFIDSDDWLHENMFQSMVELAEKYKSNTVCCGHYNCNGSHYIEARTWQYFDEEEFTCKQNTVFVDIICKTSFCWDKLLNGGQARSLRFDESLRYGEDLLFLAKYFSHFGNVVGTKKPFYYYRRYREGNTVSSAINDRLLDYIHATEKAIDIFHSCNEDEACVLRAFQVLVQVLYRIPVFAIKKYKKYLEESKKLAQKVKPFEYTKNEGERNKNNFGKEIMLITARHFRIAAILYAKMINRIKGN